MSFYQALEDSTRALTASERRIGGLLLADPRGAPFMRIADIAARAEVHESTVVRFAQKLGYSGFIDMREALVADSLSTMDRTIAMREEGEQYSLAVVVSSQIKVLESLSERIPQERIDAAVEALRTAARVHVVGSGLLLPLVETMRAKLVLNGLRVDTITESGRERAQRLVQVDPDDVMLVFAFAEEYAALAEQLRLLSAGGTTVVLITDEDTLMMSGLPELVVAIPRDRVRHGVLVPMTALCYAIHYDLLRHRTEESRASRARIEEFLAAEPPASRNGGS